VGEEVAMNDTMTRGERRVRAGQTLRILVFLVIVVAMLVFALVNTDKVSVDWVAKKSEAPLWAVIAISAIAGAAIGALARMRRS
jgi:uncharacterized integral membrane protein